MRLSRLLLAALLTLASLPGCSVELTDEPLEEATQEGRGLPWDCRVSRGETTVRWGERRSTSAFPTGVRVSPWNRSTGETSDSPPSLDCGRRSTSRL